jgi:hypothetical protein
VKELTAAEVAEASEVPLATVRYHLRSGRLVGRKFGRDWVITPRDAARWMSDYVPYDTLREKK